jgi:lipopolysaccharide cholinephosphotransferase
MYKVFVGGLATIGKFIPMKAIFFMQKAIALKDKHSKGDLRYYSNYQPDYLYVTLHKDWCEEVIDAPFEDTTEGLGSGP